MAQVEDLSDSQMALVEVKICPFCTGDLQIKHEDERHGDNITFDEPLAYAQCDDCNVQIRN